MVKHYQVKGAGELGERLFEHLYTRRVFDIPLDKRVRTGQISKAEIIKRLQEPAGAASVVEDTGVPVQGEIGSANGLGIVVPKPGFEPRQELADSSTARKKILSDKTCRQAMQSCSSYRAFRVE